MVKCVYQTDVLVNDPVQKTLAIVMYGIITVNNVEVCKTLIEVDIFTEAAYYTTIEYDVFIDSWKRQQIEISKRYIDQIIRFYQNVETIKSATRMN